MHVWYPQSSSPPQRQEAVYLQTFSIFFIRRDKDDKNIEVQIVGVV